MLSCKNERCDNGVERNPLGRPREYCSRRCREAARRADQGPNLNTARAYAYSAEVRECADDLLALARTVHDLAYADDGSPETALGILRMIHVLDGDLLDLSCVGVQHARARKVRRDDIIAASGLSKGEVRGRTAGRTKQRLQQREQRRRQAAGGAQPPPRSGGLTPVASSSRGPQLPVRPSPAARFFVAGPTISFSFSFAAGGRHVRVLPAAPSRVVPSGP
ncbi:hypothetical protein SAMN06297387_12828 [Streptomyces zhaozhouensis]|uniref:Uncharacterized protein n=1 Tax=Streptomyces zhaozhouensis TaxID=1300267 RepID=A0A286E7Y2_9ACTN|nr:hypothetical protein [Streptomyces zhaozhouensis]SOD67000.1 hypothetical protein SAMN06297387_12828 [Streptomyces zhaozhouensis]